MTSCVTKSSPSRSGAIRRMVVKPQRLRRSTTTPSSSSSQPPTRCSSGSRDRHDFSGTDEFIFAGSHHWQSGGRSDPPAHGFGQETDTRACHQNVRQSLHCQSEARCEPVSVRIFRRNAPTCNYRAILMLSAVGSGNESRLPARW